MEPMPNIFFPLRGFEPHEQETSAFEQLISRFAAHEYHEQEFLEGYRDIVDRNDNPLVRFLLQLIMSDEEKHHGVVRAITSTLNDDLTGRRSGDGIPKLGPITADEKDALSRLTARFIETEKEGIREYKALLKPSADYYGGLLVLLIRTIIHDSEKHMMILEFIAEKHKEA